MVTLNGRVTGVRDPYGTRSSGDAGRLGTDHCLSDQLSFGVQTSQRRITERGPDRARVDGNAAIRRAEGASTHGCRPRHLSELGVDARHVAAQSVGDPDGAQSDRDSRRCPIVERNRRSRRSLHGIDPRQRSIVEIAHPDRAFTRRDRSRADTDLELRDDLVRRGVDQADVVRLYRAEAAGGISSKEKRREDQRRDQREDADESCHPPAP